MDAAPRQSAHSAAEEDGEPPAREEPAPPEEETEAEESEEEEAREAEEEQAADEEGDGKMKAGATEENDDDEKGSESSGTFSSDMTGTARFKSTIANRRSQEGESRGPTSSGAQGGERQARAPSDDFSAADRERPLASMIVCQLSSFLQSVVSTQQAQHAALLDISHKLDRDVGVCQHEISELNTAMKNLTLQILEDRQQQQVREQQSSLSMAQPWFASQAAAALAQARTTELMSIGIPARTSRSGASPWISLRRRRRNKHENG